MGDKAKAKVRPLLCDIHDALYERGWKIEAGAFVDPEGNRWSNVAAAVDAQTMREIAMNVEDEPARKLGV